MKDGKGGYYARTRSIKKRQRSSKRRRSKAGIKTGIKTGKMQQAIIVAKKMLAENLDVNLIMKITGLKKEQFMK